MEREELRHKLLDGIDRARSHTWVVSAEDWRLLSAVRALVLKDDTLVDRIAAEYRMTRDEPETPPAPQ